MQIQWFSVLVVCLTVKGFDVVGIISSTHRNNLLRYDIKMIESYLAVARENDAHQIVAVIDIKDFKIRDYLWTPGKCRGFWKIIRDTYSFFLALETLSNFIRALEANYPEVLKECYVVNGKLTNVLKKLSKC